MPHSHGFAPSTTTMRFHTTAPSRIQLSDPQDKSSQHKPLRTQSNTPHGRGLSTATHYSTVHQPSCCELRAAGRWGILDKPSLQKRLFQLGWLLVSDAL
jgi:hypothetical protein